MVLNGGALKSLLDRAGIDGGREDARVVSCGGAKLKLQDGKVVNHGESDTIKAGFPEIGARRLEPLIDSAIESLRT